MSALAWGGHKNGQIPAAKMKSAGTQANGRAAYLEAGAAAAFGAFAAAFRRRFGKALNITEAYRDLAEQRRVYALWQAGKGNLAAVPGTSNHGWARALDLGSRIHILGSAEQQWAAANGPAYGWQPTGLGFSQIEPWHFDFNPGGWSGGSTPTPSRKRHSMSTLYRLEGQSLWALAGDSPGTPANWRETKLQSFANELAAQHGTAATLSRGTWDAWKADYLAPLGVAAAPAKVTVEIDYTRLRVLIDDAIKANPITVEVPPLSISGSVTPAVS